MRELKYCVAMSLDGFIAGPNGEYDWIIPDPTKDFQAFFKEFDTLLMGRRTFEMALQGPGATLPGMKTVVCSRTLKAADYPDFTISADAASTVAALKSWPGKDIWLFGGAALFRSLLDAQLVDRVEVGVMPILLSQGVPLLPTGRRSPRLRLTDSKTSPNGIVGLTYTVAYESSGNHEVPFRLQSMLLQ
jgi:dihydrofolate reductase